MNLYGSRYRKASSNKGWGMTLSCLVAPALLVGSLAAVDSEVPGVAVVGGLALAGTLYGGITLWRKGQRELDAMLDDYAAVFLCGVHSHERNIVLKYCVANGIVVYIIPRVGDVIMSGAKKIPMFHLPMMRVDRYCPPPEYQLAKRTLDLLLGLFLLLLFSPLLLIAAIAVKIEDGGPVFYRQTRLTKDGQEFNMLKFRSMVISAEQDGVARLSTGRDDPRITRVGRVLRAHRIDELPQLFNVLGGSMSLVGPRPERPEIAAEYEREMPEFALRLQCKAGLTGYAQVYGKYNTTPYDKLQMDLMYISRPSIVEDIKILFATFTILFRPDSTEGVAPGQVTAGEDDRKPAA